MNEVFGISPQGILMVILMAGGFLVAGLLAVSERGKMLNKQAMTSAICERSWNTSNVLALIATLLLLYFLAGCSGQFFYEEQIPLMRLVFTFIIYIILISMMIALSRKQPFSGSPWACMGLDQPGKILLAPMVYLAAIPFIMLASKAYSMVLNLISTSEIELQEVAQIVSRDLSWLEVLYILMAIFAAPVYEEILFRGIVFPYCAKRIGLKPAIAVVSIFFALMHFHLASFVPLSLLSAVLCLAYWRTGSLWPGIGVHMIFNAVTILALNVSR